MSDLPLFPAYQASVAAGRQQMARDLEAERRELEGARRDLEARARALMEREQRVGKVGCGRPEGSKGLLSICVQSL